MLIANFFGKVFNSISHPSFFSAFPTFYISLFLLQSSISKVSLDREAKDTYLVEKTARDNGTPFSSLGKLILKLK